MVPDYLKATQEGSNPNEFFNAVLKLKTVKRQGWANKLSMKSPESVADHCYATTAIAMLLSDQLGLDTLRVIKMSLLHDLAESLTGDITPESMSKAEKRKLEDAATKKILKNLNASLRREYLKIWKEYCEGSTKESVFMHQIDKLEMALQAREYRKRGYTKKQILPFIKSAASQITDRDLANLLPDM